MYDRYIVQIMLNQGCLAGVGDFVLRFGITPICSEDSNRACFDCVAWNSHQRQIDFPFFFFATPGHCTLYNITTRSDSMYDMYLATGSRKDLHTTPVARERRG